MSSRTTTDKKKFAGVEFVPLNVPLKRRLQTLAVLIWLLPFMTLPSLGIFLLIYLFFYTSYGFISVLYVLWLIYDRKACNQGGRRIDFLRKLNVWKRLCAYFPINLVKTAELDASKNYLFGYHPHGIFSIGAVMSFGTEGANVSDVIPGIKISWCTLAVNFKFPLFREYVLALGGCSVDKESLKHLLSQRGGGHGAVVVPGGAREALYSHPKTQVVYIKNRKGFIKVALETGASLVPVYAFGETDVYPQVSNPKGSLLLRLQERYLKFTGVAPVLPLGRGIFNYTFGWMPHRRQVTTVVGAPIHVDRKIEPGEEEIDALHQKYIEALTALYNSNREKYGDHTVDIDIL